MPRQRASKRECVQGKGGRMPVEEKTDQREADEKDLRFPLARTGGFRT